MDQAEDLAGLSVSRETMDRLKTIQSELLRWNPAVNLVSRATLADAWSRHIVDSAQLYAFAPADFRLWADLGSGGGFPGLIIAALAAEKNPSARIVLVEADQRKAAFLIQALRKLGLSSQVIAERIEAIDPLGADVISARALASLDALCGFALRHAAPGGVQIFPKGANHSVEVAAARQRYGFDLVARPSMTDPAAAVLLLSNLSHGKPDA